MASEQFSLCWDNFHKNMSSGMNSLLESEDLVDVTLAVQGKCLKAHKMVLSVCSPYFKELFKSNPCQHPIVFMKDVSYEALSDLLQFMYQGEVQVSQENLTTFIKTAEALQIKGLTGDGNGTTEPEPETPQEQPVHQVETYKPTPRPKKTAPAPIPTSPQVKRQRLSVSSNESQPLPPSITKTEPVPTPSTGVSEAPVQFKMEPYDQSQNLVDETGDDNFGDDTLDDNTVDDSEDYSMMEGGVGEEEPQAGTSTDGAGEGQDTHLFGMLTSNSDSRELFLPNISNVNNSTIQTVLEVIIQNQSQLMKGFAEFKAMFAIAPIQKNDVYTGQQIRGVSPFKRIDTLEELNHFNEKLKDPKVFDIYVESLSVICGKSGRGNGINHCYRLVDKFFTRRFFTLCSWAGGAKIPKTKFPFKFYENVINLFFKLVNLADNSFTLEECEVFFKNVIRNSVRRSKNANLRISRSKNRPKNLAYRLKGMDFERTDVKNVNEAIVDISNNEDERLVE